MDTLEKKCWTWAEKSLYASEPVFIPHPDAKVYALANKNKQLQSYNILFVVVGGWWGCLSFTYLGKWRMPGRSVDPWCFNMDGTRPDGISDKQSSSKVPSWLFYSIQIKNLYICDGWENNVFLSVNDYYFIFQRHEYNLLSIIKYYAL